MKRDVPDEHTCEPLIVYTPNGFWRGFREEVPWFPIFIILMILTMLVGLSAAVYLPLKAYERECHGQGGHIITPRTEGICVDRENRVIIL